VWLRGELHGGWVKKIGSAHFLLGSPTARIPTILRPIPTVSDFYVIHKKLFRLKHYVGFLNASTRKAEEVTEFFVSIISYV
jgi:hypothetical protein